MKKNTSCSCNDHHNHHNHHACPPMQTSDIAKAESFSCEVEELGLPGTIEENVVLQDVSIQTLVEAHIKLPDHANEIKHIRKNVRLTQCKALTTGDPCVVKLFVEGFVHKNIQFVQDSHGFVKDFSVDVPFRCFHQVTLANPVQLPEESQKGNIFELRQLAKNGMGADRCEFGSFTFEVNNEPIKCKLLASAVNQWDITHDFDSWGRFDKITEKMEVLLVIKLTQLQQLSNPLPTVPCTVFGPQSNNIYSNITRR